MERLETDLATHLVEFDSIVAKLRPLIPSVRIECPPESPGGLQLLVGGWNQSTSTFGLTPRAVVQPGETTTIKLAAVHEGSGFKEGEVLVLRPVGSGLASYLMTNLEPYYALTQVVSPHEFPWWGVTQPVPGFPTQAAPSGVMRGYLTGTWELVWYYWLIH